MAILQFDRFAFDTVGRELRDRGTRVPLTPTESALLSVMLRSRDAVVTHAMLLQQVWPGVHVSTATVTRQMSRLRSRLGDSGSRARIIETVARRGYRLLATVRRPPRIAQTHASAPDRAAVLPIALLSLTAETEALASLAHGLTERLIDRLASLPGARIVGLASVMQVAGRGFAASDVTSRLSAGSVMVGTVRTDGDHLVALLELIAPDSTRLWGTTERVPRGRSHLLEGRVIRSFARWFAPGAGGDELGATPTPNAKAYEQLMAGMRLARNFWSLSHVEAALTALSEAIRLDPHLAVAHLALADVHLKRRLLGESKEASRAARASLDAVLAIDPECAPALAMHGVLIEETEWDRDGALAAVTRAAALAPHDSTVQLWCASFFDRRGQYDKSLAHLDAGLAVDPLSTELLIGRLSSLVKAGRHGEARKQTQAMMPLMNGDIGVGIVACVMAVSHAAAGRRRDAMTLSTRIVASPAADPASVTWAIIALAKIGELAAARAGIDVLKRKGEHGHLPAYCLAAVYAAVGEKEKALDFFEQAVADRSLHALYGATTPGFDSIQDTPRFRAALRRMGIDA